MRARLEKFLCLGRVVGANVCLIVVLLVAVEWGSSLFVEVEGGNLTADYYINHKWKPSSNWVHSEWVADNSDFRTPYIHYYNRQSWLERYDVEKAKSTGSYRIFYVGDSFTEGTCAMEDSVPSRVESALNEMARGTDVNFEVINTGTSSYSPTIYYLLVRHILLDYDPDLIVINVDMTDCFDDWKYSEVLVVDADGKPFAAPPRRISEAEYVDTRLGAVQIGRLDRIRLFLMQNSHFYNLVWKFSAREAPVPPHQRDAASQEDVEAPYRDRWAWCRREWSGETERDVARTASLLESLVALCRGHGVRVVLTSVPHYEQYARRERESSETVWSSRPHRVVERLARQLGVVYIDSLEALRPHVEGTRQDEIYYAGDIHFNPRGYALWAKVQLDGLLRPESGLLPEAFLRRVEASASGADEKTTGSSP